MDGSGDCSKLNLEPCQQDVDPSEDKTVNVDKSCESLVDNEKLPNQTESNIAEIHPDGDKNESDSAVTTSQEKNNFLELPFCNASCPDSVVDPDSKRKKIESRKLKNLKLKKPKKEEKPRPNYFISVRVQDDEIHSKLKIIQEDVIKAKEALKVAIIPPATFHLTLCLLRIDSHEDLEKAIEVMESCGKKLKENGVTDILRLTFKGLDTFRNQVLFAKVKKDDGLSRLEQITDIIYDCFEESGLCVREKGKFTPHLTLVKLSKGHVYLRKKKIKSIPTESYKAHIDELFGVEKINTIQLLSMAKAKASDGHYHCDKIISFSST